MSEKYCNGCNLTKSIDNFQSRIKRGKLTTRARCHECENAYARSRGRKLRKETPQQVKDAKAAYYARHPRARIEEQYRRRAKEWGYDPELVLGWVRAHNGCCDACGDGSQTLHLDHCHERNEIRGMLCGGCNLGLGHFKDDAQKLRMAIGYLERTEVTAPKKRTQA